MPRPPKPYEGKMHIKKGDTVQIITGKDKGRSGKVLSVNPKEGTVVVEDLNIVTKHVKGQPTKNNPNPQSGRLEIAAPIAVSKVALVNAEGKPTRVRIQRNDDGSRVRVAVNGGKPIAEPEEA